MNKIEERSFFIPHLGQNLKLRPKLLPAVISWNIQYTVILNFQEILPNKDIKKSDKNIKLFPDFKKIGRVIILRLFLGI